MADWPARGERPWDDKLKAYVDATAGVGPTDEQVAALVNAGGPTAAALSATIAMAAEARAAADLFIDFTGKPNGAAPVVMDTGQAADTVFAATGRAPVISGGRLTHGALPASGAYADYHQSQAAGDLREAGTRFYVDSSTGTTSGIMCLAVWDGIFEGTGAPIPKTPAHITIDTVTGQWQWFVSDGGASDHLQSIKQGTFTKPASDGATPWDVSFWIDPDAGIGYMRLPGVDAVTGTRFVTLTDAEIATYMPLVSLPVVTFAELVPGADVLVLEHFASAGANTAIYPEFEHGWAKELRVTRDLSSSMREAAVTPPRPGFIDYAPSTQQAKTLGTSSTVLYTDTGNTVQATVAGAAGPTGKVYIDGSLTIEFGGSLSRVVTGANITAAGTSLTAAASSFNVDDIGRQVIVPGAGPGGATLVTVIAARPNTSTLTLADAASTTVSSGSVRVFTPSETVIYARVSGSPGGVLSTPSPAAVTRGRAGQTVTVPLRLTVTGLTPGEFKTWRLDLSRYSFGDGTATVKFGGTGDQAYPALRLSATPA